MTVDLLIKILLASMLAFQAGYFFIIIKPFLHYKDPISKLNPQENSVNILVIMKNELHNINGLLKSISNIKSNIILIDDHSNKENLKEIQIKLKNYKNVNLLSSNAEKGKKHALVFGIEKLDEYILQTDADCRPVNASCWVKKMSTKLKKNDVVIGYGPFFKNTKFLNKLIRFEALWIASQYFGWSQKNLPYMAVGRNIAFKKSTYERFKGEIKGKDLISGDDDLFIQAISAKAKIDIAVNKETFVYSACPDSYIGFLKQKSRHITTAGHYKLIHKAALGIDHLVKIFFYPALILSTFIMQWEWILGFLFIKILLNYIIYLPCAKKLEERDIAMLVPFYEMVYGMHLIVLTIYSLFTNKKIWK